MKDVLDLSINSGPRPTGGITPFFNWCWFHTGPLSDVTCDPSERLCHQTQ